MMYKVYFDGKLLAETDDWDVACDCAIENDGTIVDAETEEILLDPVENEEEDYDFDEADLEMDFNPYMGCYDFDC